MLHHCCSAANREWLPASPVVAPFSCFAARCVCFNSKALLERCSDFFSSLKKPWGWTLWFNKPVRFLSCRLGMKHRHQIMSLLVTCCFAPFFSSSFIWFSLLSACDWVYKSVIEPNLTRAGTQSWQHWLGDSVCALLKSDFGSLTLFWLVFASLCTNLGSHWSCLGPCFFWFLCFFVWFLFYFALTIPLQHGFDSSL